MQNYINLHLEYIAYVLPIDNFYRLRLLSKDINIMITNYLGSLDKTHMASYIEYGNLTALTYFEMKNNYLKYDEIMINSCRLNHIYVLEWFCALYGGNMHIQAGWKKAFKWSVEDCHEQMSIFLVKQLKDKINLFMVLENIILNWYPPAVILKFCSICSSICPDFKEQYLGYR